MKRSVSLKSRPARSHFALIAGTAIRLANLPIPRRVQRFAEITTLHGLRDFLSGESKVFKVLWGITIFMALACLCYEIVQLLLTFIQQPIATHLQIERLSMNALRNVVTPYACVTDWISKQRVSNSKLTHAQLLALNSFANVASGVFLNHPLKPINPEYAKIKKEALGWVKYYQNEMNQRGTTLEDYFENIRKEYPFHRKSSKNCSTCGNNYLIFTNAVCFPIGLHLVTDEVGVPIFRAEIDLLNNDTYADGLYDKVHRSTEEHLTIMFYHGQNMRYLSEIDKIHVEKFSYDSSPIQLNLRMRFKLLQHIPRWSKECITYAPEDITAKSKYPVNYVRQICMLRCMDDEIYQLKHNCTFRKRRTKRQIRNSYLDEDKVKHFPLCTAEKFFDTRNFSKEEKQRMRHCQDSCEDKAPFCTEWDVQMERQRWVSARTCAWSGCLNLAIVAHPTLEVSQELLLMNMDTFLSNLGGQAGLWFGGSILSIVQIIFFCALHGCTAEKIRKYTRTGGAMLAATRKLPIPIAVRETL